MLVVIDQFTRRIMGFGIRRGDVDGPNLCRMFNKSISASGQSTSFSLDNYPIINYYQWQANLRIHEIEEIKTIPYVSMLHPFAELLIGTTRRVFLDHILFWTTVDLERKLSEFKDYCNHHRAHSALPSDAPAELQDNGEILKAGLADHQWKSHRRALLYTPAAE